jgi:hypothetical protein
MEEEWVTEEQISKVDSVLKSLARDWSAEEKDERSVAYDRIIGAIESYYENTTTKSYINCSDHIHRRANVRTYCSTRVRSMGTIFSGVHSREIGLFITHACGK